MKMSTSIPSIFKNTAESFLMPGEWHPHSCCWMLFPTRHDNWRKQAKPAMHAFSVVAKAIAKYEPVKMGVLPEFVEEAKRLLFSDSDAGAGSAGNEGNEGSEGNAGIEIIPMLYDDSWMRDVGPTFLVNKGTEGTVPSLLCGVDWRFNAWGEMYDYWGNDDQVASKVLDLAPNLQNKIVADFILEGGSIHVDGEGTILTTEECLLHTNRNPSLSKLQIEQHLLHYLGGSKVIWLPLGLVGDEDTNGHVDNMACFSRPGQVLLSWTDDPADPFHPVCRQARDILLNTPDAQGRTIEVIPLPIPSPMYYTPDDLLGLTPSSDGTLARVIGDRLAASYVNFYLANGAVICPSFGDDHADERAASILRGVFKDRVVVQVPGREVLLGGGNIHCITQQQPRV